MPTGLHPQPIPKAFRVGPSLFKNGLSEKNRTVLIAWLAHQRELRQRRNKIKAIRQAMTEAARQMKKVIARDQQA